MLVDLLDSENIKALWVCEELLFSAVSQGIHSSLYFFVLLVVAGYRMANLSPNLMLLDYRADASIVAQLYAIWVIRVS